MKRLKGDMYSAFVNTELYDVLIFSITIYKPCIVSSRYTGNVNKQYTVQKSVQFDIYIVHFTVHYATHLRI